MQCSCTFIHIHLHCTFFLILIYNTKPCRRIIGLICNSTAQDNTREQLFTMLLCSKCKHNKAVYEVCSGHMCSYCSVPTCSSNKYHDSLFNPICNLMFYSEQGCIQISSFPGKTLATVTLKKCFIKFT